jgi:ribosome maturation factor RimP
MVDRPDAIAAAVEPALANLGLSLYDVELAGSGGARTLRVLVDRSDGSSLDLAAITAATNAVSPLLDSDPGAARALHGSYTLEVSSPGLERPLRTPVHFRGAVGTVVSLKTGPTSAPTPGSGEPRRVRGVVTSVDDHGVELEIDGERETFAYADITQARTVFEWGAKKPKSKSKKQKQKQTKKMQRVS